MINQTLKRYGWLLLLLASPIIQAQSLDDLVVKEGIYYKKNPMCHLKTLLKGVFKAL